MAGAPPVFKRGTERESPGPKTLWPKHCGRWADKVWIEWLWRSVKYENVYLQDYQNLTEARRGLGAYFEFYNHQRHHQSLDYRIPAEIYYLKKSSNLS